MTVNEWVHKTVKRIKYAQNNSDSTDNTKLTLPNRNV